MAQTVRIEPAAHVALTEIARANRLTLTEALTRAVETYRRELLIQAMSEDYAELRKNPKAWAAESAERALWDQSLTDGLEHEGVPTAEARGGARQRKAPRRAPSKQAPVTRPKKGRRSK